MIALVKVARSSGETNLCQITHKTSHTEGNPATQFTRNKDTSHSGSLPRKQLRCAAEIRSICFSSDIRTSGKAKLVFISQIPCALNVCVCKVLGFILSQVYFTIISKKV